MHSSKFGVSQSVTRKEDDALIRGRGRYVADVAPTGALHAVVRLTDIAVARGSPGVHLILTAPDIAGLGGLPCVAAPEGMTIDAPPYPVLARDVVRHVGDAVAFIVADTTEQGKDAAEAISIEWEALPHVVGARDALAPGAPPVWPGRDGNVAFETTLGDRRTTADAFAAAANVVSLSVVNQRLVTNFLDTRAVVAEYDAAADRITLTLGSQGSHLVRDILANAVLKIAPEKLHVVTPDVGGGFGTQGNESRLTRLWLQRAESVQQVLRVPGGALAAALD
jgi:carbon-monoxide dehydrogenase large subunit